MHSNRWGDMNAKLAADKIGRESIMCREALGEMNENGELFADFCAFNDPVIGGNVYKHNDIQKATWTAPGGYTTLKIRSTSSECEEDGDATYWTQDQMKKGGDVGSPHSLSSARDLPNQVEIL
ncbi:unnamed protein product [Heterobilharzia americana]|nr:unnamed protein product [Heterobilharzia americana]